jgi:hypothetical protein
MNAHILFTARDIGAGHHLLHVIRAFERRGCKTTVVATPPSYDLFRLHNIKARLFLINGKFALKEGAGVRLKKQLVAQARELLVKIAPDALLSGLSSADHGVDEAFLLAARELNIPSFQYLDCGGTFNHWPDGHPQEYLAIDRAYSYAKAPAPVEYVGSPKHEQYAKFPIVQSRRDVRQALRVKPGQKLVGYFGQDPRHPGYLENFESFASAVRQLAAEEPVVFMLRGHPGYRAYFAKYEKILKGLGITAIDTTTSRFKVEDLLCGCDLVVTCFSTVGVDHAYLNHYAKAPTGTCLYVTANTTIRNFLTAQFGFWKNPLVAKGMGAVVTKPSDILPAIHGSLSERSLKTYFQNTRRLLSQDNPCDAIIKRVTQVLEERAA